MKLKLVYFVMLFTASVFFSCSKFEQITILSKEELIEAVSKSDEFNRFYELSQIQSNLVLSSSFDVSGQIDNIIKIEVEKLQLTKKKHIEKLLKIYGENTFKSFNRDDFRVIVQKNIAHRINLTENNNNSNLNLQTFDAASCKKQYDKEVNQCFENFLIDEAACFFESFFGLANGCFIGSIRDQLKCNRAADSHFKECK